MKAPYGYLRLRIQFPFMYLFVSNGVWCYFTSSRSAYSRGHLLSDSHCKLRSGKWISTESWKAILSSTRVMYCEDRLGTVWHLAAYGSYTNATNRTDLEVVRRDCSTVGSITGNTWIRTIFSRSMKMDQYFLWVWGFKSGSLGPFLIENFIECVTQRASFSKRAFFARAGDKLNWNANQSCHASERK